MNAIQIRVTKVTKDAWGVWDKKYYAKGVPLWDIYQYCKCSWGTNDLGLTTTCVITYLALGVVDAKYDRSAAPNL